MKIRKLRDNFSQSIYDLFESLINENVLTEEFTSEQNLEVHFNKHCVGKNSKKKSSSFNILYDFETSDEYKNFESIINKRLSNPNLTVKDISLSSIQSVISKLFGGNCAVLFDTSCGFTSSNKPVYMGFVSFTDGVTTNYDFGHTISMCVLNENFKTVTLFAISSKSILRQINACIANHAKEINKDFNI